MTLGTKTLLFGVHQIIIHPLLVIIAWMKLYHSFPSWKELICIVIHDWGYCGKPNLKNEDGDRHPELGANIAHRLFDKPRVLAQLDHSQLMEFPHEWKDFVLGHSSFYVTRYGIKQSKLLAPDKYWHCIIPLWFYKCLAVPTGEFKHYRELNHARQVANQNVSDKEWWSRLQRVCKEKVDGVYEINKCNLSR